MNLEAPLRVVFMGTPDFAVPTLRAIAAAHDVVRVVSQPDRPKGRGKKMVSPPVAVAARELGLDVRQPKSVRRGPFQQRMADLAPDVAVVIAYGRILPKAVLDTPKHGCVNVHASLLPRWRGAAPIQWAIAAGDDQTGVCTQRMEEGLDTGPIYLSYPTPIDPRDTAATLHDRLAGLAATIAVDTLARLTDTRPTPQDEDGAIHAPILSKADGQVDWTQPAIRIDQRIRGFTPWPGGFTARSDGQVLKLLETRPTTAKGPVGQVLSTDPLVIGCGEGALELVRVQRAGRKPVSGPDFARGARLVAGGRL